jgi:hypothetical protein
MAHEPDKISLILNRLNRPSYARPLKTKAGLIMGSTILIVMLF